MTSSTSQLSQAHQAEIEALSASHATALSALQAEHSKALSDIQVKLNDTVASGQKGQEALDSIQGVEQTLRTEVERLTSELENVQKQMMESADGGSKEVDEETLSQLAASKKRIDEMKDELEGTKEVRQVPTWEV